MKTIKELISNYIHILIFMGMIVLSFFVFKDYGIAWDDPEQREIGIINYNFVVGHDNDLLTYRNRSYGVVIELPLVIFEKVLELNDSRDIFLMRHIVLHLFFLLGVFFFYLLLIKLFNNKAISISGMLMLYLTPTIFAHSFFNSKDIPLMVFIIIGMYTLLRLILNANAGNIIIHALISALAFDTRIMGAIIPISTVFLFFTFWIFQKKERKILLKTIVLFTIINIIFIYIFSPAMWLHPLNYIHETLGRMVNFPWRYETLYLGEMISAQSLPWHYSFVWIFVSIPIFYIVLMLFGYFSLYKLAFSSLENFVQSKRLLFIGLFSDVPFLVIFVLIFMNSTLYDGWRHIYFLYPFLLLMAIFGLNELNKIFEKNSKSKFVFNSLIIGLLIFTAIKMIELHPYEQVYYNSLLSHKEENIRKKMEMDYWGLSYKQALEYIAKTDPSKQIKVRFENFPGEANVLILPNHIRNRFIIQSTSDWDYFISNYRQHPKEYEHRNVYNRIRRSGSTINITYRKEN